VARHLASPVVQLAVLAVWAGYCISVTAIGAADHFELSLFLLYLPAQLILGFLVPRWASLLAPVALTVCLGWLAFHVACPCREDGVAFYYALWALYFALPGAPSWRSGLSPAAPLFTAV
jgi:hypothetical protein